MNIEDVTLKEGLINYCIKHQENVLVLTQNLMNEAQQMANDYGAPKDRYDSFRTKQARQAAIYANQFDLAQQNVKIIKLIDPKKNYNKVEFGSLVITNTQNLLIGAAIGKIEFKNTIFYSISVKVPIFQSMKDKQEGEEFVFNGIKHKIVKIL